MPVDEEPVVENSRFGAQCRPQLAASAADVDFLLRRTPGSPREPQKGLDTLDGLVYRSNLLGGDRTLANQGGGNTSAKGVVIDHAGPGAAPYCG